MKRAIILAAGKGERLLGGEKVPKPLCPVLGKPLLARILDSLKAGGVEEVGLVVGFQAQKVETAARGFNPGVELSFFQNAEYEKPNGTSLLKAAEFVHGPTFLLMSDHLFAPALFGAVRDFQAEDAHSVLGVDFKIDACPDVDDATKVQLDGDRITAISKQLETFDALDTGVFRITRPLLDVLKSVNGEEGCSLSDGVGVLSERGHMRGADVGDARWIDVDTPEMHRLAEAWLQGGFSLLE